MKATAKGLTTVAVDEPRFGHLTLTTGQITVPFNPKRPTKCRVIAFNWAAHPKVNFHSLN